MYTTLEPLRLIEAASFVAAPSAALHMAQLGARVIRIDPVGGGPDFNRWPKTPEGQSLYWQGLQKGKQSVAIDLGKPEGRELAVALITAPGEHAGLFMTNYPRDGFLSHQKLCARRPDLISLRVQGWADGGSAVDYTVNAVTGLPYMTGPVGQGSPVNHVLPAWDLLTGALAAFHLLAAERSRRENGQGQEVLLPLSSVAFGALGSLGQLAEVELSGVDRPRGGNNLFGAFGRDFVCADDKRVMVVAITRKQWSGLVAALDIAQPVAALERQLGVSFDRDEGLRYAHREQLDPLVEQAIAQRDFPTLARAFAEHDVCWAPYRTLSEAMATEPELSQANPMMQRVAHPGGLSYLTPDSPASYSGQTRSAPLRAPRLGEHTELVLAEVLGLATHEIGGLLERGLVARAL